MGTCWKCNKQVSPQEGQTRCDNCQSIIYYHCNNCSEGFNIIDKEAKEKLIECKVCGYFICPHCSVCYWKCKKNEWQKEVLKILVKDIPISKFPTLPKLANEIVDFIKECKISRERKTCPNGVPISYSKGRIKNLWAKVEGFRIKNENDRDEFVKRIKEATDIPIGSEITINKIREDGNYGQEYRDALNLLVCMGRFKIKWKKDKEDNDYCVFIRDDCGKCPCIANESVIIISCPNCKKVYYN